MSPNFLNTTKPVILPLNFKKMSTAKEKLQINKEILYYESKNEGVLGFGDFEKDINPSKISFEQKVKHKISKKFQNNKASSINSQKLEINEDLVVRFNNTQQNFGRKLL